MSETNPELNRTSLLLVIFTVITLSACGGGGTSTSLQQPEAPLPVVETPTSNTCTNEIYSFSEVRSDNAGLTTYTADKAADGITAGESRWQSDNGIQDIIFDLGE